MERGEQRAGKDDKKPKAEAAAELREEYDGGEREKRDRRAGRKGSGTSTRGCQAEMCVADLTDARPYYRRHRVCELHAKAPIAVVGGARQRFCQQCSRWGTFQAKHWCNPPSLFHEISEFDGAKRSCRKRLSGHNERRRKSSAEPCTKPSSRKISGSSQLKEIAYGQLDDRGRIQISIQENSAIATYNASISRSDET